MTKYDSCRPFTCGSILASQHNLLSFNGLNQVPCIVASSQIIVGEHFCSCFWHSGTTDFQVTSVRLHSSDQVPGLAEVTRRGPTAKKNTRTHFPSQFPPPPRSPVNLFCEIPPRVSVSLAALPSPEMRSLRRARLIFTRWDCDRMESGERGKDEGGVMWFLSGKSEYGN